MEREFRFAPSLPVANRLCSELTTGLSHWSGLSQHGGWSSGLETVRAPDSSVDLGK